MLVDAWECLINFRTRSLWANLEQVQLRLSWRQVKLAVVETSPNHYSNTNRPQHFFSEKNEICLRPFFSPSHTFVIVTLMHCIGTKFYLKKNWSRSAGYLLFMITNFGQKVCYRTHPFRSFACPPSKKPTLMEYKVWNVLECICTIPWAFLTPACTYT